MQSGPSSPARRAPPPKAAATNAAAGVAAPRNGPALPALDREGGGAAQAGHGPISQLQEFVQSSRAYPVAPHRQILQWSFQTRMADSVTLEFRATVAFLLEGVPHHVAGSWRTSKKLAQRATAEQALRFFVGRWGSHLADYGAQASPWQKPLGRSMTEVEILEAYCQSLQHTDGVRWQLA